MSKKSLKPEARTRYVYRGMSVEALSKDLGVSVSTMRRWLNEEAMKGDDWGKARIAAHLSTGGVEEISQAMMSLLSRSITRANEILAQAEANPDPQATIELIGVIRGLSDAYLKTIHAAKRGSPEIDRVALVADFVLLLDAFILREHPHAMEGLRQALPEFSKELIRVYGKSVVNGQEVKAVLARAAPTKKIDAIDPKALFRIREEVFGVPGATHG
ncbi:MAG: DUF1804 family protein [Magnetococcales bacterium]|nr:DUF1804 family protein [Magnetococcales bacterium]